jgi:MinD-like ATPase involved in chromosome partitioning or flagellar assembly
MSTTNEDFDANRHAPEVDRIEFSDPTVTATETPAKSSRRSAGGTEYVPPTKGVQKIQFKVHKLLNGRSPGYKPLEVPPGKAEAFERQVGRIKEKQAKVAELTETRSRIIVPVNAKGGAGKTPSMGYLSCIQADITRDPVVFVDANTNMGTADYIFGIDRKSTILLREAVTRRHELDNYTAFKSVARRHPSGVRFVGSDVDEDANDPSVAAVYMDSNAEEKKLLGFNLTEFNDMIGIHAKTFHTVYIDNGNGFADVTNLGCVESANALIFSALTDKPTSFAGLIITMNKYIELGFGAKVKNGFIVINATKPGDTKEMYIDRLQKELTQLYPTRKVTNHETQVTHEVDRTISEFGITEDRLFLVPFSQHIRDDKVISTDPTVIGYDTYESFLDILIAIFKQNAKYAPIQVRNVAFSDMKTATQQHINA